MLTAATQHVAARLAALAAPPPRPALWRTVLLVALIVGTIAATAEATRDAEHLFDIARRAYSGS